MPLYSFRDLETSEIFDIFLSIKDLDEYKKQHPQYERYIDGAPSIVSGVSITGKLDDGFKDVLSKISEAHPDSELASQHGRKTVRQTQTERAVRKWKDKQ